MSGESMELFNHVSTCVQCSTRSTMCLAGQRLLEDYTQWAAEQIAPMPPEPKGHA